MGYTGETTARRLTWVLAALIAVVLLVALHPGVTKAATGINSQVSFQGKVVSSTGVNLADGVYNMQFKIYQDGTNTGVGSTLKWTENRLVSGGSAVTVTSGTFQVNLGSVTAFSGIDWNQDTLWLSMQVGNTSSCTITTTFQSNCGGDGEMTPFIRFTSVPYALNAGSVNGLTASQLVQLTPGAQQTGTINVSGTVNTNTFSASVLNFSGPAPVIGAATTNSNLTLQANGSGTLLLESSGAGIVTVGTTAATVNLGVGTNAKTVNIGTSTGTNAVNIGTNTTAAATIILGSSNASTTAKLQGGGTTLLVSNSNVALTGVQNIGGTTSTSASTVFNNAAGSTQNVLAFNVAGTNQGVLRADSSGGTFLNGRVGLGLNVDTGTTVTIGAAGNGNSLQVYGGYTQQTSGTNTFIGATGINTTGTAATTIGNSGSSTSVNGVLNVNSLTSVPTADQVTINNTASTGVTTAGVNGLGINYKGGAAAVEAAGMRVDFAPGTTSGGTWSGLRIVAGATGPVSGVTAYGIKLEGPTSAGAGTEEGLYIGSGWDVGLDIASGGIQLAAQSDPATPAAGQLRLYAKAIAGRVMPKWIGPSGVDTPVQASFGFNRIAMSTPSGLLAAAATTVFNTWGVTQTNAATSYANPALASTNLSTSVRRGRLTSATTASAMASSYSTGTMVWRGNAAGVGGFFYTTRFNFATLQSGNRAFVGLRDVITAPSNIDPTAATTPGSIGIAINANTGNLNWVNHITGTAPTVTGLGANFPVDTTSLYELVIFSPPNGSGITYRVKNLSTGNVTADTTVTTNIPANTTFLAPSTWMTNNATLAAVAIDSAGWYMESDN